MTEYCFFLLSFRSLLELSKSPLWNFSLVNDLERGLDLLNFSHLDEMSAGHFFDYTVVFCYFKKLVILWRWKCLDDLKGQEVLKNSCLVKS